MSAPRDKGLARASAEADDEAAAEEAAAEDEGRSLAKLVAGSDVDGLLALAKAYRSGTGSVPRDLKQCFECYRAAAGLGSAAAEHAVALFYLTGGVVERDEREGAARLRSAADQGHTPAKVYLANLYELGIHYKADAEKADVWYRNAARSSGLTLEPGTPEHLRAMAEIGCVRHCLEIVKDEATTEEDRAYFLKKAKTHGYRDRASSPGSRSSSPPSVTGAPMSSTLPAILDEAILTPVPAEPTAGEGAPVAKAAKAATKKEDAAPSREDKKAKRRVSLGSRVEWGHGLTGFVYASVFMGAALAGGHLLTEGARVLVADGQPVPVVGDRIHWIAPLALGLIGVFPTVVVYRIPTVGRAILVGAFAGLAGELAWGFPGGVLFSARLTQIVAFSAAGFLAALLVLGLFGGVRSGQRRIPGRKAY